jgi:hypothetical protein
VEEAEEQELFQVLSVLLDLEAEEEAEEVFPTAGSEQP